MIVVAPAPVFGWQTLELIQRLIGAGSPAAADLESWGANPQGFADILELILAARPPLAVLLGGDVHYAFAAAARVTDAGSSVPVAQFTSSATKNETRGVMGLLQAVLGLRSAYEYGGPDVRCWWVPAGDGPVSTYALDSLTAPLALPIVRILADGRESFREQAKLTSLADGGFPADVLLRQVIQATSNVGELRLDGTTLQHRFWVQDGANTRSMPMQEWAAANWPVPPTSIS